MFISSHAAQVNTLFLGSRAGSGAGPTMETKAGSPVRVAEDIGEVLLGALPQELLSSVLSADVSGPLSWPWALVLRTLKSLSSIVAGRGRESGAKDKNKVFILL